MPSQLLSNMPPLMLTNVGVLGQPVDLILVLISEAERGILVLALRQPVGLNLGGEHREAIPSIQRRIIGVDVHPCSMKSSLETTPCRQLRDQHAARCTSMREHAANASKGGGHP